MDRQCRPITKDYIQKLELPDELAGFNGKAHTIKRKHIDFADAVDLGDVFNLNNVGHGIFDINRRRHSATPDNVRQSATLRLC